MARAHVIGAGITGLTSALALRKFAPWIESVRVVDAHATQNHLQPIGVGLWQNAVECLSRLCAQPASLLDHARWSRPAAYRRATDGLWLSQASLQDPCNAERILLFRRQTLMQALERECVDAGIEIRKDSIMHDWRYLPDGRLDVDLVRVDTDVYGKEEAATDLLVLATGTGEHAARSAGSMGVFGGVVKLHMDVHPFESIGNRNRRFALIPLSDKDTYWFATMRAAEFQKIRASDDPIEELEKLYADFHEPIRCTLEESRDQGIELVENVVYTSSNRRQGGGFKLAQSDRVIALGDCSSYMPHNLAQGASLGIEQAYLVASALSEEGKVSPKIVDLLSRRRNRCKLVTDFTRLLARYPRAAALMAAVPDRLNGFVFDQALEFSQHRQGIRKAIHEIEEDG